jgi:hypothetical protein
MKRIRILPIVLIAALIAASWSCSRFEAFRLDDLDTEMEFKPGIIAPLAYGSFNLQDVLEAIDTTGFVSQTEDSLLFIYYTDSAYSVLASDIVDLPDKVADEIYIDTDIEIADWNTLLDGQSLTFTKVKKLEFEIEANDKIDSIRLKEGNLNMLVTSEFRHAGELTITSSHIYDSNGDSLNLTFAISQIDGMFNSDEDYPMAGYTLYIQEDAGMAFIRINYNLTLIKEAGNGIAADETADIKTSFEGMDFSHVYGFVADREVLDVEQTLNLDFFDIASSLKDITLKAPEFNLHVANSYGIPMEIDLSQIVARSTIAGTTMPLVFNHDSLKTFNVKAPKVEELGQTVNSIHYINGDNSNLEEILSSSPNKLDFDIIANTGTIPGSGIQNFLLDTSKMDIVIEVVLPMWLKTGGFALENYSDMDIGAIIGDLNFIDSAKITMNYTNEFPLEVRLQGYFLDSDSLVLDSLFSDGSDALVEAAQVDENGVIVRDLLFEETFEVGMTGEQMANLSEAKILWIKADASTTDLGTKFVKFYSHYVLEYSLFMDAQFTINTNELDFGSEE